MRKLTTEEFVQKAKEVHGDKYDYSKSIYTTKKDKLIIICPIHGEFQQSPDGHLRGQGCPKCKAEKTSNRCRKSIDQFIKDARKVHEDKYDYSKFNYINSTTKGIIICPIHGEFLQSPSNHLAGKGCPKCGKRKIHEKGLLSLKEVVERAKQIHPEYDYSKSIYKGIDEDFNFICPIHGEVFLKTRSLLYNSCGCPKCHKSKGEQLIENYLIHLNEKYETQHKVITPISIRSSGYASVDFYLPEHNLFIEYNGIQHYKPVERFGGQLVFEHQQKRDQYIRKYCKENNIKLLEISYDNSNILKCIDNALGKNIKNNVYKYVAKISEKDMNKISQDKNSIIVLYKDQNFNKEEAYIGINKELFYNMLKTSKRNNIEKCIQIQFQTGRSLIYPINYQ